MSYESRMWAWSLEHLRPAAKLTLLALADVANEEGRGYCSQRRLIRLTYQSEGTIKRILRELEGYKLITRVPRFVSPEGFINTDGVGRQIADGFALHLDVTKDELRAQVETEPEHADLEGSKMDPPDEEGGESKWTPGGVTGDSPKQELNYSTIPKPLPSAADQTDQQALAPAERPQEALQDKDAAKVEPSQQAASPEEASLRADFERRWAEFSQRYPDGVVDPPLARAELVKLSPEDCVECITSVSVYAERCRRRKEKPVKAHLFVRKRVWTGLKAEVSPAARFVVTSSQEGAVVRVLWALAGETAVPAHWGPKRHPDLDKWGYFLPPGKLEEFTAQLRALAALERDGKIRRHDWPRFPKGSNEHGAWNRLLEAAIGKHPPLEGGSIRAPWPFPPRVDGSIGAPSNEPAQVATGPPAIPEPSDEDIADFTVELD